LKEEHGAVAVGRNVAGLVNDEDYRMRECLESVAKVAGSLGLFERGD